MYHSSDTLSGLQSLTLSGENSVRRHVLGHLRPKFSAVAFRSALYPTVTVTVRALVEVPAIPASHAHASAVALVNRH